VFYAGFSERRKLLVDLLSAFLCIAISAAIIWLSLQYVQQSYVIGEQSPDPGGLTHRWVLKALIPVGFVFLILQCIAIVLGTLEKLKALKP
jgi:TRAP-type mannitol/chloroaromatic compound transport system permease small subunit